MITSTFLNKVAEFTDSQIAKVVLNDTIEITNFAVKEITASKIGMQYIVPAALVSLVTKIDLRSSTGEVITSNDVYVPIASDTLLLQTITVREGA